jgi:hypothetical protein
VRASWWRPSPTPPERLEASAPPDAHGAGKRAERDGRHRRRNGAHRPVGTVDGREHGQGGGDAVEKHDPEWLRLTRGQRGVIVCFTPVGRPFRGLGSGRLATPALRESGDEPNGPI